MKKKNIISILILIGFAIVGYFFLKGHMHELVKILEVDLRCVIILSILLILQSLFRGQRFKIIMEFYGIKLKFKEWMGLEIMNQVGNELIPFKGGASGKAVYLKKKYKFPFISFVGSMGVAHLSDFLYMGLFGTIVSLFLPVQSAIKYGVLIFFALIFLSNMIILFFLPLPIRTNIKVLKHIANSVNELQRIRTEYLFILRLGLNAFARCAMTISRLYFGFLAFGVSLPFYTCVVMGLFLGVSKIISITPMSLGFRESIIIASSKLFSVEALLGAFVAALDRAIAIVWSFIAAPIVSYILVRDLNIETPTHKDSLSLTVYEYCRLRWCVAVLFIQKIFKPSLIKLRRTKPMENSRIKK